MKQSSRGTREQRRNLAEYVCGINHRPEPARIVARYGQ
jgi:hypothetical protein